MSSTASPYGARPVGTLVSAGYNAKINHYKIASGYATAIFAGDFVKPVAGGGVEKDTGTTTMTPIGIFVGCMYTDPNTNQLTFNNYWPASTVAADAVAYVADDPFLLFEMQADEAVDQADVHANFAVVQTAGSTTFGRSKNALDGGSHATAGTLPLRLVGFVTDGENQPGDAYTRCLLKFNAGHFHLATTGL